MRILLIKKVNINTAMAKSQYSGGDSSAKDAPLPMISIAILGTKQSKQSKAAGNPYAKSFQSVPLWFTRDNNWANAIKKSIRKTNMNNS